MSRVLSEILRCYFREKFRAHKLVLAARSVVFEAEISDGMEEDDKNIVVTDMEPNVFKVTFSTSFNLPWIWV